MIKQWFKNILNIAPPDVEMGNLQADKGSVVVGKAADGSQITVNNWSVSEQTIAAYASPLSLPKAEAEKVSREYLQDIETYYRYLPLKGMGDNSGLRLHFSLVKLFVPLNARMTLPRGDTLPEDMRVAGRRLSEEECEGVGGKLDDSKPILDLLNAYSVLVILGDPGSGKSTVVRFMAYVLATGQGKAFGLAGYLPLLLPLSAYSEALSDQTTLSLRKFAESYFSDRMDTQYLGALLDSFLQKGKVLILLDGLDEVKEVSQRNIVVDRVQVFLSRYVKQGNRAILTSRIIGYQEVRPPEIAGLRECTLLDFEDSEVKGFIHNWTAVIESQVYEDQRTAQYEAQREAEELISTVDDNAAVRKLAANPLLLTMLVIQKRQGSQLPRHRVVLYERYITSLLHDWQLARNIHATSCKLPNERALRRILEPLAWWLQEAEPGKGLVAEVDLLSWLRKRPSLSGEDSDEKARQFIIDVRENSGLLIDRGGQKFGFLHLTFMEYLAGVSLANQLQQDKGLDLLVETICRYAKLSEWREVLLLAIGHIGLNQRQEVITTKLLQRLIAIKDEGAVLSIAAAALADIGEDGVLPESWQALKQSLLDEGLLNVSVKGKYRVSIGQSLGIIGDPRAYVMDVDAMRFCAVPAGKFFMGKGEFDQQGDVWEPETPAGEYDLSYDYWMAQHLVTNAQFMQFLDSSALEYAYRKDLKRDKNHPVVRVSRAEAVAFCQWLTTRWHRSDCLPDGWCVRLPDEAEWEKAARGGLQVPAQLIISNATQIATCLDMKHDLIVNPRPQRRYPWGNEVDAEALNYAMNIGFTTTVNAYPLGASPYGCQDMAGNVWEWTSSELGDYPYPEVKTAAWYQRTHVDKREEAVCVLRGGAFNLSPRLVRCAVRRYYGLGRRDSIIGFRVVLSPLL